MHFALMRRQRAGEFKKKKQKRNKNKKTETKKLNKTFILVLFNNNLLPVNDVQTV